MPLPRGADVQAAARTIGFPLIVKPACEGSSVGVSRVFDASQLDQAVALATQYPGDLLMETLIEGAELTVSILGRDVLPSIHIVPKAQFYDFNAKYVAEDTQYLCPGLEGEAEASLRALALRGSYTGSLRELTELVELVKNAELPYVPTRMRPLEEANAALDDLRAGRVIGRQLLGPGG